MITQDRNVALVLSGGGARGIAHIGVIEELNAAGFKITSVAGSSMGALVGGMLANHTLDAFTQWLLQFTRMNVIKFLDLTVGKGGLVKGEKIIKALHEFIGDMQIEDLEIPFACVATDLHGHKEITYTSGSLLQAIRASISIPTVFKPVIFDNMLLVDGGVLNPLPLDVIRRKKGDLLVAVNVNSHIAFVAPPISSHQKEQEKHFGKAREVINERWSAMIDSYMDKHKDKSSEKIQSVNLFDIITDSINLTQNKLAQLYIEKFKPDMIIETSYKSASIYDFYKSEELIEYGRTACREVLKAKGYSTSTGNQKAQL